MAAPDLSRRGGEHQPGPQVLPQDGQGGDYQQDPLRHHGGRVPASQVQDRADPGLGVQCNHPLQAHQSHPFLREHHL